ncbi:MAG: hypothetical protein ACUVV1_03715 [Fimbriimonadales bacterium]
MDSERPRIEIDGAQFRERLEAVRAAQARIDQEKTAWLRQLTPEQSQAIYFALWEAAAPHRDLSQPSEFIMRLQKVFQRMYNTDEPSPTGDS